MNKKRTAFCFATKKNLAEEKTTVVFLFVSSLVFANSDHEYGVFLCVPLDVRTILNTQFSSWHTQKSARELYRTKQPTELWLGMSEWKATMETGGASLHTHEHTDTHRHIQRRTHTTTRQQGQAQAQVILKSCVVPEQKKTSTSGVSVEERMSERMTVGASALNQLTHSVTVAYQRNGWMAQRHMNDRRELWIVCERVCNKVNRMERVFANAVAAAALSCVVAHSRSSASLSLPLTLSVEHTNTYTLSACTLKLSVSRMVWALFINCKASLHHFPGSSSVSSCTLGDVLLAFIYTSTTQIYTFFSQTTISALAASELCASFLMAFKCVLFSKQWQFIHFALNAFGRWWWFFFALALVDPFRNGWMGFVSTPVFQFPFEYTYNVIFHQYPSRHRTLVGCVQSNS